MIFLFIRIYQPTSVLIYIYLVDENQSECQDSLFFQTQLVIDKVVFAYTIIVDIYMWFSQPDY
jgi:hypothetical protein